MPCAYKHACLRGQLCGQPLYGQVCGQPLHGQVCGQRLHGQVCGQPLHGQVCGQLEYVVLETVVPTSGGQQEPSEAISICCWSFNAYMHSPM